MQDTLRTLYSTKGTKAWFKDAYAGYSIGSLVSNATTSETGVRLLFVDSATGKEFTFTCPLSATEDQLPMLQNPPHLEAS